MHVAGSTSSSSSYPRPDPITPQSIHPTILAQAAYAVHRTLSSAGFHHLFFGGFEVHALGCTERTTKDVDVEVEKPMFRGFEKVRDAFKDDEDYILFDGNRTDALRMIHRPTSVGIDVMMRGSSRLPKKGINLTIPTTPQVQIPCFPITNLFIEKIKSCGERKKEVDARDVMWLYQFLWKEIILDKVRKRLNRLDLESALMNHPGLEELLVSLEI